jgi:hypothetical protein
MANIKKESSLYFEVRKDFERLVELHNWEYPYDFTGGFVFEEKGMQLMECPTKKKATDVYIDLIAYSMRSRFGSLDSEYGVINKCEEVREIYRGYFEDEEVDRCFSLHEDTRG